MTAAEFVAAFVAAQMPTYLTAEAGEENGEPGVVVKNGRFSTKVFLPERELATITPERAKLLTHQGRNVLHYTRVTGYFSAVENWNPGKRAELSDRYRTPL